MTEFFQAMEPTERFYWYLAIGASVIFIIQTVMTFIGADTDTGVDADFDGNLDDGGMHPFQLFSLRNLVNFLLGLGWGGVAFYSMIENNMWLAMVAALIGVVFVLIFVFIMNIMMKLAENNTFEMGNAIGQTGDVYLTIPEKRMGKGKVFISVKGSTRELDAITDYSKPLKNGMLIKVVALEGDMLIVEPLSKF